MLSIRPEQLEALGRAVFDNLVAQLASDLSAPIAWVRAAAECAERYGLDRLDSVEQYVRLAHATGPLADLGAASRRLRRILETPGPSPSTKIELLRESLSK